jgi:hypothetical protein
MDTRVERARLYEDMRDVIGQAHRVAKAEGFTTIIMGNLYAVIPGQASLSEALESCLPLMVDTAMKTEARAP